EPRREMRVRPAAPQAELHDPARPPGEPAGREVDAVALGDLLLDVEVEPAHPGRPEDTRGLVATPHDARAAVSGPAPPCRTRGTPTRGSAWRPSSIAGLHGARPSGGGTTMPEPRYPPSIGCWRWPGPTAPRSRLPWCRPGSRRRSRPPSATAPTRSASSSTG